MVTARIVTSDAITFLRRLPERSVDLVFGSPPYEDARTYGIGFKRRNQDWVDWMVEVFAAAQHACRGLVAFGVEGKTRKFRWSATPALLMADLHRGGNLMGHPSAHLNEAPFPEGLPEFFMRSFCPPGGMVVDPFLGSGTTGAVATRWGRNFMGCDLRPEQVAIARERIAEETPVDLLRERGK